MGRTRATIDFLYRRGRGPRSRVLSVDPVLLTPLAVLIVMLASLIAGVVWLVNKDNAHPTLVPALPRTTATAASHPWPGSVPLSGGTPTFLPLLLETPPPAEEPIWAPGDTGDGPVALFRKAFVVSTALPGVELSIMADTRYELWLDGAWLGRGPARFSRHRQEFDAYTLGSLPAGRHVLAALVQFAPNLRRSESSQAALQVVVRSWDGAAWHTVAASDTSWRALISPAWDAAAEPICPLGLIGPMEVLDLRRLPVGWSDPAFDDAAWPQAQVVVPSPFPALSARTIPLLRDEPRPPQAVIESGLLSPGYQLIEFQVAPDAVTPVTASLAVTAQLPTMLQVEAVDTAPLSVDGGPPLAWMPLDDERRPDVVGARRALSAGRHSLSISVPATRLCAAKDQVSGSIDPPSSAGTACMPVGGRTVSIRMSGLLLDSEAGVVAVHDPGRRTLLANPVPGGPGAPDVQLLPDYAQVAIPAGNSPRYVVLDFGRTLYGRMSLVADGPAGTVLDAGWDERLTAGRPLPDPGSLTSSPWSQVDSWVLDGTPRHLATIDARSGRYLLLQVFGPGPVTLHQVRAIEEVYPAEQTGHFVSSDPLLNRIWQTGVDTLRVNMVDAYTDTPWRERGQWWADALIAFHSNWVAYGDLALFRRGLRQMADAIDASGHPAPLAPNGEQSTMLDYGMQWIEGLHLYWQLSGDLALVSELYPAAGRLAGFLATYEGSAGLLDVPKGPYSQTALVDWSAGSSRSGESTALNAQYAAVLRQLGEMAEALGEHDQAQAFLQRSAVVQAAINDHLFALEGGCYSASRVDAELKPCSLHAQAWALRYGVVPAERQAGALRTMLQQLTPFFDEQGWTAVEPPGMFYVLAVLDGANATDDALALIRERYGDMLDRGATTWWELYTPNQHRFNSLSHAYASSPTWFLSAHVLGAKAVAPSLWRVVPHPGDLAFARGAVPFGAGTLDVDWRQPACGQFELSVTSPVTSIGEIVLPVWRLDARVTLDGVLIWDDGPVGSQPVEMTADGLLIRQVGGGSHQVTVYFDCLRVFLPDLDR